MGLVTELMHRAREHLWDGDGVAPEHSGGDSSKSTYICYSIEKAGAVYEKERSKELREAGLPYTSVVMVEAARVATCDAEDLVQDRLDGCMSYDGFLCSEGVPYLFVNDPAWVQLRRRELLTMCISDAERRGL